MVSYKALNTDFKASCWNDIDRIGYGDCFEINTDFKGNVQNVRAFCEV